MLKAVDVMKTLNHFKKEFIMIKRIVLTVLAGIIELTINPGPYTNGMEWLFITYPIDTNIELDDFSVPIINLVDLDITVTEQLTTEA